jgi:hypothetical protein
VGPRAGLDGCGKSRPPPTGIRSSDRPARRIIIIIIIIDDKLVQNNWRSRFLRHESIPRLPAYCHLIFFELWVPVDSIRSEVPGSSMGLETTLKFFLNSRRIPG